MSSFKIRSFITCALGCVALLFGAAANAQVILHRESAPQIKCETPDWQAAPEAKKWSPENYYTTWYQVPPGYVWAEHYQQPHSYSRPEHDGVTVDCVAKTWFCIQMQKTLILAAEKEYLKLAKQNKKKK